MKVNSSIKYNYSPDVSRRIIHALKQSDEAGISVGPFVFMTTYLKNSEGIIMPQFRFGLLSSPAFVYDLPRDFQNAFYLQSGGPLHWEKTRPEGTARVRGDFAIPKRINLIDIVKDHNSPVIPDYAGIDVLRLYIGESAYRKYEIHMQKKEDVHEGGIFR